MRRLAAAQTRLKYRRRALALCNRDGIFTSAPAIHRAGMSVPPINISHYYSPSRYAQANDRVIRPVSVNKISSPAI